MAGDDTLLSDPLGSDYLTGDAGIDTVDLTNRTQDLKITIGFGGTDDGQAGEGDQTAQATERWLTGSGNDIVEDGWDDENTFQLGPGNDTVYARRATDASDGGEGTDTLSYAPFESPSRVYFRVKIDVFAGAADSNEPTFVQMHHTFTNFERFVGGGQADRLIGGPGPDYLEGGGGDDLITGGLFGDTILGGAGNDELRGEEGDDRIEGGDGLDAIYGDTGADTMLGGPGRDSFEGGEPDPPDEETDEVLDWEGPNMTQEPNCFSANPCPP